jgi:hypothetical protein
LGSNHKNGPNKQSDGQRIHLEIQKIIEKVMGEWPPVFIDIPIELHPVIYVNQRSEVCEQPTRLLNLSRRRGHVQKANLSSISRNFFLRQNLPISNRNETFSDPDGDIPPALSR